MRLQALHKCIYSKRANVSRHAAGTAPLTFGGARKENMEREKQPVPMPEDLKKKWEAIQKCYKLLAEGKAKIACKMINDETVYYTESKEQKVAGEQIEEKRRIAIGDYRVQQASNRHVAIVHIPDNHLVFHSQTDHWLTEEEMKTVFEFYKQASRWGCSE